MALLSLALLFSLPALSYAEPIHIQLSGRAPVAHDLDFYKSAAEHLRGKYGISRRSIRRATSSSISITNQNIDSSYFASVNIGTPPQTFNIILDTGSADLWVADTGCTQCPRSTQLFDPTKSSSFQASNSGTTIKYGSGQVSGQIAQDAVSMGGFNISNQQFLAVNTLSSGLLSGSVGGILGLAFQTIAATGAKPFWEAQADAGQLTTPEMSFFLTRFNGNTSATALEPGGTFTLGGTDPTWYTGNIEFLNLNAASFWMLSVAGVTVQGNSVPITTGNSALAAIDTGTTLIGGPTNDVRAIWNAVGGTAIQGTPGFFQFPCNTNVNVSISFGGQSWPINPQDMNIGQVSAGSSQCVGAIFDLTLGSNIPSTGANPTWVVGATFLKNVYSVFRSNPPSVGFAQLSAAAGGSGTPGAAPAGASSSSSSGSSTSSANKAAPATLLVVSMLVSLIAACSL